MPRDQALLGIHNSFASLLKHCSESKRSVESLCLLLGIPWTKAHSWKTNSATAEIKKRQTENWAFSDKCPTAKYRFAERSTYDKTIVARPRPRSWPSFPSVLLLSSTNDTFNDICHQENIDQDLQVRFIGKAMRLTPTPRHFRLRVELSQKKLTFRNDLSLFCRSLCVF